MPSYDVRIGGAPGGGVALEIDGAWLLVPSKAPVQSVRRHLDGGPRLIAALAAPADPRKVQLRLNRCFTAAIDGRVVRTWKELAAQLRPAAGLDMVAADVFRDMVDAVRAAHATAAPGSVEKRAQAYCDEIATTRACIARVAHKHPAAAAFGDCPAFNRSVDRVHAWGELSPACRAAALRSLRATAAGVFGRLTDAAVVLKLVHPGEPVTEANARAVALRVMRAVHPDKGAPGAAAVGADELRDMQTVAGDVLHLLGLLK